LIAIVFVFTLFEFVGWFGGVRSIGQALMRPVLEYNVAIFQKAKATNDSLALTFRKSEYIRQLEQQQTQALVKLTRLERLEKENDELRRILGDVGERGLESIIVAPVISFAYPTIGVGSKDGVVLGNMVLSNQVLLGIIETVGDNQSRVALLNQKGKNRILAKTQSDISGLVEGDGRNILLTHVPRDIEVLVGERVVTLGQEGIEGGVLIGEVQSVDTNPSTATLRIIIRQPTTFYDAVVMEVR
jgi:rod shape-determining protein MreC